MQYHNHLENHKTGLTAEGKQANLAALGKCTPSLILPRRGRWSDGPNNVMQYPCHLENHKTGLTAEGKQANLAALEKCTPSLVLPRRGDDPMD